MGEQFAQPFVDRRVTERFRELLTTGNAQLQVRDTGYPETVHLRASMYGPIWVWVEMIGPLIARVTSFSLFLWLRLIGVPIPM